MLHSTAILRCYITITIVNITIILTITIIIIITISSIIIIFPQQPRWWKHFYLEERCLVEKINMETLPQISPGDSSNTWKYKYKHRDTATKLVIIFAHIL